MKTHKIAGGGGVQLHVEEAGNPEGRPIVFIHGFSQCCLAWSRQMNSSLAEDHRLLAMDLRGHGQSDKPRDAYGDSRLWADDVNAIIKALDLDHPVLSGWSYGALVILDYIRHYGDDKLGGIQLFGAITKLGSKEAISVLTPEFFSLVPDFFSTDAETSVRALSGLLTLCFVEKPSVADLYLMLGYNFSVPAYVRQALFSRSVNNDDLLPDIRKPVLITHGVADAIVKPAIVNQHKAAMRHAEVHMMAAGHAAFWEDAAAFNERLHAFCESLEAVSSIVA